MLCPNVLECGTVGHHVCEAMGVSATVHADFVCVAEANASAC